MELYHVGEVTSDVYVLDVSSAYPAVMLDREYPVEYLGSETDVSPDQLGEWLRNSGAVAVVKIRSPIATYPVRHKGYLKFATGEYWTSLAGPELWRAYTSGHLVEVAEVWRYRMGRPFESIMEWLFKLREVKTSLPPDVWKSICKRLAVSFYGKFGQKVHRWETQSGKVAEREWSHWSELDADRDVWTEWRSIGQVVQKLVKEEFAAHAFPAVCAYVCSYLREDTVKWRGCAGEYEVYLRAVDCLHTSRRGYERLQAAHCIGNGEPGRLRLVGVKPGAVYLTPGHYTVGTERTIVGIPPDAVATGHGEYLVEFWPGENDYLSRPNPGHVRTVTRPVTPPRVFRSGRVGPKGWVIPPHLVDAASAHEAKGWLLFGRDSGSLA